MTDSVATAVQAQPTRWRHALTALAIALIALTIVYRDAAVSLIDDWLLYATYTHGFLIVPISSWLIWQKRAYLSLMSPKPDWIGLFAFVLAAVAMSLVTLASVKVAQQFSFVAILVSAVWAVLGRRIATHLAFPLLFLFLAVPMGVDLVQPLMEFTATFTVAMLQFSGIPVYREGLFFIIPSGNWSVVEACSGLRYLIASVTLGLLYAYLTYSSMWRRIVFVTLAAVVPVLANGFRAYMIVMIGHLSDMKLAVGVDHLLYGWVFFGLVMLLLFWLGSFWSEPAKEPPKAQAAKVTQASKAAPFYAATILAITMGASFTSATARLAEYKPGLAHPLVAPTGKDGWVMESGVPWPDLADTLPTEHRFSVTYRKGERRVGLAVSLFPTQNHESDAVSVSNKIFTPDSGWREIASNLDAEIAGAATPAVNRYEIARTIQRGDAVRLTLLQWYRLGSRATASDYMGKIYTAFNLFYPQRTDGAYIVVAAPSESADRDTHVSLASFMRDMGSAINTAIDTAVLGMPSSN